MPTDNFAVVLSLITIGVAVVVGGIAQTDWKHKWLVNGMIGAGGLIILIGLTFPWLREGLPRVARFVADIATNPASWFSVIILLLSANLALRRRSTIPQQSSEDIKGLHKKLDQATGNQTEVNRSLDEKTDKLATQILELDSKIETTVAEPDKWIRLFIRRDQLTEFSKHLLDKTKQMRSLSEMVIAAEKDRSTVFMLGRDFPKEQWAMDSAELEREIGRTFPKGAPKIITRDFEPWRAAPGDEQAEHSDDKLRYRHASQNVNQVLDWLDRLKQHCDSEIGAINAQVAAFRAE